MHITKSITVINATYKSERHAIKYEYKQNQNVRMYVYPFFGQLVLMFKAFGRSTIFYSKKIGTSKRKDPT